ncbi:RHS repeat-associated core domain-containing protein, partial [Photorhabdus sp. RM323S]|uniref:RHS repeat-associated core domain-containing protein n=1 Tax=Photorhabdus sp. RM323S TaxID=3342828 RepID=UPI0036DE9144
RDSKSGETQTYCYESHDSYTPLASIVTRGARHNYYWYHTDINGAPLEVTNEEGKIAWAGKYRLFGELDGSPLAYFTDPALSSTDYDFRQNLRYAGQYFDNETGLHFNTFRYYAPETGRFITPDPIGLAGGLNLYQYAPNPMTWIDPWGWSFLEIVGDAAQTTGKKFQGAEIYKFTGKVKVEGIVFKKSDYFYLDNLHKDHYETFSSLDKSKGVFNLDGSYNEKKSIKAAKRKGPGC